MSALRGLITAASCMIALVVGDAVWRASASVTDRAYALLLIALVVGSAALTLRGKRL